MARIESGIGLIVICATVEVALFWWLCSQPMDVLRAFIEDPDSAGYWRVAHHLVDDAQLVQSSRTLGYPLFLAFGYGLGGESYGRQIIIATQLLLNLVFTWMCWRFLERLTPAVSPLGRGLVTLFFFWAGLGMALYLLTDFLGAFLFSVCIYGLIFWDLSYSS